MSSFEIEVLFVKHFKNQTCILAPFKFFLAIPVQNLDRINPITGLPFVEFVPALDLTGFYFLLFWLDKIKVQPDF